MARSYATNVLMALAVGVYAAYVGDVVEAVVTRVVDGELLLPLRRDATVDVPACLWGGVGSCLEFCLSHDYTWGE